MSERQYFALRYAIPGYAFILVIIAINYVPLLKILGKEGVSDVFGAFLGFLTLFSGSAIGFLISQGWWWWWQRHYGILGVKAYEESIKEFCRKYELDKPECDKNAKREFVSAVDYVSHITAVDYVNHSKVHKKLLTLAERRWDMYHLLSSTFHALWIGLVAGIISRLYFEIFLFESSFSILSTPSAGARAEALGFIFMVGCVAFLLFFLYRGRQWIQSLCASLHEARIRISKVTLEDLRGAFERLYDRYGRKTKR